MTEDSFDVCIRFGAPPDARVIARRIAPNRRLLRAAPAYLAKHGIPKVPSDLTRHNGIGIRQGEEAYGVWRLSSGRANQLNPEGSRRSVVLVAIVAMSGTDELIAADTGASPTLAALASAAGYSKAQFVRLFRRTTGTSPHRYVLHRRLEEAQRLIKTSALPLAEVTSETGFASQSHLTNAFVRFFGCTPGDARRGARH